MTPEHRSDRATPPRKAGSGKPRTVRINAVKRAIASGEYRIDANAIARRMLRDVKVQ